jgi:glutathione S-transferase
VALARAFLEDALSGALATGARVSLATTSIEVPVPPGVERWQQGDGDLGARLERVSRRALADAPWVLLVGGDSPGMPREIYQKAIEAVASGSAALAPADDGGFVLLGLPCCPSGLFDGIPWSTPETGAATARALSSAGLRSEPIPGWFDLDEPADLDRFRREVAPSEAPATWAALGSSRRMRHVGDPTGARMDLALFHDAPWMSPYVLTAFVVLEEKGLPYELIPLSLDRGEQRSARYGALSVTARVPTLRHGEFALAESSAIAEYLEDVFPAPPVFPADARERARARQVMAWVRSDDTLPIREERPTSTFLHPRTRGALGATAVRAAEKAIAVAERVTGERGRIASEWCIADTDLAILLYRLVVNGDPVPPGVRAFVDRELGRASVVRFFERTRLAAAGR